MFKTIYPSRAVFSTALSLFISILFTAGLFGQPCSFISGNVSLGGAAHDPGYQEVHPVFAGATLSNQNFVMTWSTRDGVDGDQIGAFFQVFDATGTPVSSVIMPYSDINPGGIGNQGAFGPFVAALTNGFVVVWESEDGPGDTGPASGQRQDVCFRVYDNSGTALSNTIRINIAAQEDHIEFILPINNNEFVLLFRIDEDNTGNNDDYFFQSYDATGMAISQLINITGGAHDAFFQTTDNENAMVALPNSKFVVAWEARDGADGDREGAYFRVFDTSGSADTPVSTPYSDINPMGTGSQGTPGPRVISLDGGNFVIAWESEDGPGDEGAAGDDQLDTYFRVYNSSGAPVSGTTKANDITGEEDKFRGILALEGGNFAIAFSPDKDLTGNTDDIYVRVFNATGTALGSSVEVSGGTQNNVYNVLNTEFSMAALSNGNFVVSWGAFDGADGDGYACFHRVFNSMGAAVTGVIRPYEDINPMGTGNQSGTGPYVRALPNGYVVVWQSEQGPGDVGPGGGFMDDQDVYHRVYDNTGTPLCGTIKTNTGNDAEEEVLRYVLALNDGNFVVLYYDDEDETGNLDDYFIRVVGGAPIVFTCPAIGSVSNSETSVCTGETWNISASGLSDMDMAANNEQDFGIRFVAFPSTPGDPYTGGTDLGVVAFNQLGTNGTTATLNGASLVTTGPNTVYAVLDPAPADANCRPFAISGTITIVDLPVIDFAALAEVCGNDGFQSGLGGGMPFGGVYSGTGVFDDGNGFTFSFDPSMASVGFNTITYTVSDAAVCGTNVATSTIDVYPVPAVTFTSGISTVNIADGVQTGLSGGSPAGGVYSGPGVIDDGNGITFTFDPVTATVGTHTLSYTFTSTDGCAAMATTNIVVEQGQPLEGDICADAISINSLFGGAVNVPQLSGVQDNSLYNNTNEPLSGYECWQDPAPTLNHTIWFSFTGDGNTYKITSVICDNVNPLLNNDTQFALYSGNCNGLIAVGCSEDEDFNASLYNALLEINTSPGVEYLLMVDGYIGPTYVAAGSFCLEVTRLGNVPVTEIADTPFEVYPNPTSGPVQFKGFSADWVKVIDPIGRLLKEWNTPVSSIELGDLPAGLYVLQIGNGTETYTVRVVKN
ncbi:MAG: T9SS type A sorting domain-containing protein [Saprospiraceae bacterium]|nr:T9SS type A sorting domain-containing protein [Saprospiraceae bacterium]MCB9344739.1 T9SS type A sorting domain-containing protein [Lewinellaceae bacterium]